jgi:eukaryotic-like serine/threonine-protein kinase
MAIRLETMAEPLPGYRLIERLGGGGFGEVWKTEAPGGLFKAIKFVYGDLSAATDDPDGVRADQELRSLERVKEVRHVFILSLEQIQIVNGQLLIVTELADRTLWDRFRECKSQGLYGIPREELHRYLSDTAEALDFMNDKHQLQHLDIKPQNLFLVENHVKVADFGLVKALQGMLASVTGGVTPVYAAPETFEGKVSRFSDQYSLAIVYQELLTGQRPYTGSTLRQLVMQHCQGTPDLKSLPDFDRPIVLRALAKDYEKRFSSCTEFVEALRRAGQPAAPVHRAAAEAVDPAAHDLAEPPTQRGRPQALEADNEELETTRRQGEELQEARVPKKPATDSASRTPSDTPSGGSGLHCTPGTSSKHAIEIKPDGLLAPAVVVGLGAMGLATIRHLRRELSESLGSPTSAPAVRLLYVDTDADTIHKATHGRDEVSLRATEVLLTRLQRPSHYLKNRMGTSGLETWLPVNLLYRMRRQQTPAGIRALGRLAFVDNHRLISRRLQLELEECCSKEALDKTARETGLTPRAAAPRIYIVTALGGGTGSGMLLDLAYVARDILRKSGRTGSQVVGICYLPPCENDPRRTQELANAYAALHELNHFSTPGTVFSARYELGEIRPGQPMFSFKGAPMDRCVFHPLPEGREAGQPEENDDAGLGLGKNLTATVSSAARMIFSDLMTALGQAADECRNAGGTADSPAVRTPRDSAGSHPPIRYQVAGLHRIVWPRRRLLDRAADAACRRLVQRWMAKDSKPLKAVVKDWVAEKWEQQGLNAESTILRFQQYCEQALGAPAETVIQNILAPVAKMVLPPPGKSSEASLSISAMTEVMEQLEKLVGVPEECRTASRGGDHAPVPLSQVEAVLEEAAAKMVDRCEQKVAEMAVALVEDPTYRLAGAEEALRQLHSQIEQSLQAHEQLAKELQQRAAVIFKRLHALTEPVGLPANATPTWRASFGRRNNSQGTSGVELMELLKSFPKCRYQWLILHRVTSLYVSLRGSVSDQLREVDYCRARLGELRELFRDPKTAQNALVDCVPSGRYVLSNGCPTLQDAVMLLDGGVGPDELQELDVRVQKIIRKQFKALVDVCYSSAAGLLRQLAPAMHAETRAFLRNRLGSSSVSEIYLQKFSPAVEGEDEGDQRLQDDLGDVFDAAVPEVAASSPMSEVNVFAVPPGAGEERLRQALNGALDNKPFAKAQSVDEIAIYREHTLTTLADLKQMGPIGQEAYRKVSAQEHFTPHGRVDIPGWGIRDSDDDS